MESKPSVEQALGDFLSSADSAEGDRIIAEHLLQYLEEIFDSEENEEIVVDDIGSFELDDFLNFYLQDQFGEDTRLIRETGKFLRRLHSNWTRNQIIKKDQSEDWKEFLQDNEI